jgi:hypothetical protein
MLLRHAIPLLFVSTALLLPAAAAEPLPPANQWISPDAVVCLEISEPKNVLDFVLHPQLLDAVASSPEFKKQAETSGFKQFRMGLQFMELHLGTDWQTALRRLLGGGVTVAVGPGDASVLIVDAENAEILNKLHNVSKIIADGEAAKRNDPDRVRSAEYRGVTSWTFGPNQAHAIIGNRLVVTNRPNTLIEILDRRAEPGGSSLAQSPTYQQAKKAAGSDSSATLYANLEVLKQLPKLSKALEGQDNPMAVLLLAGVLEALRDSDWLALGLDVEADTVSLSLASEAAAAGTGASAFTQPNESGQGAMPNFDVPRQIASASVYRDLHGFYAAKDDLFPERTSGLIFFENMMGIFFTGRDLTEEVLAETGPDIRLVVAEQKYDPAVGTPATQVPAFAAVFSLKNPDKFKPVMEEAWQKALGLINFTRGQAAQPGLILDKPTHGDTKYTTAGFAAPTEDDRSAVDIRFNFSPSLAMPGGYMILSSSDKLAEDLIDAIEKETAAAVKPLAGKHSLVQIDGGQLASILGANREQLIRNNMVEDGNTREQAETAIGMLLMIVERVASVKLDIGNDAGRSKATLSVQLNMAPEEN